MTKLSQQTQEEIQNEELLLRRFKLVENFVDQVKKRNLDNGLDPKRMGNFVQYEEPFKKKQYLKFLKAVTNP